MKNNPTPISQREQSKAPLNPMLSIVLAGLAAIFLQGACSPIVLGGKSPVVAKEQIKATDDCNPVIFIHGTMGSRLVDTDTGRVVWGDFSRKAANGKDPEAVRGVALCMERGRSLEELKDSTEVVGYLDAIDVSVLGVLKVKAPIYGDTAGRFGDIREAADPQPGCYGRQLDFYFDWRRSYDENARLLAQFMREKKRELIEEHGFSEDMKFDVVAHSQGALVFKYFLRYGDARLPEDGSLPELTWAGAPYVDKIVYIGIPSGGVVPTLDFLTNGHQADKFLPFYEPAVVGTMPAIYQMLPRARDGALIEPETGRKLDPLDYDLWVEKEWGLANPEQDRVLKVLLPEVSSRQERRRIALDHLHKCLTKTRRVQAALDRPATPPSRIKTVVCVSDSEDTMAAFFANPRHVEVARIEAGDGTVTVRNAIRETAADDRALFFKGDHLQIVTAEDVNRHITALFRGGRSAAPAAAFGAGMLASNP